MKPSSVRARRRKRLPFLRCGEGLWPGDPGSHVLWLLGSALRKKTVRHCQATRPTRKKGTRLDAVKSSRYVDNEVPVESEARHR
ncbi:unnamed protein product, partial [Ectocarpus fasciculatus]